MKIPFKISIDSDIAKWRVDTFWEKEPETIEWIKNFSPKKKSMILFFLI